MNIRFKKCLILLSGTSSALSLMAMNNPDDPFLLGGPSSPLSLTDYGETRSWPFEYDLNPGDDSDQLRELL
ncbi:MAG: hypothetical protein K2X90_03605 [Candidatus Babeliaceae bacterium]|nr:hypothetical protein [Candidatus Babeliaceae bacterium]